jgi:RimJ/RimL family protein N-acetyltransferase
VSVAICSIRAYEADDVEALWEAAQRQVAEFAFANTDPVRLEILCAVGNDPSQRVAERAGAVREGVLRHRLLLHGQPVDAFMYGLVWWA